MHDPTRPAPDAKTTTREDRTTRPDGTERVVRTVVIEPMPVPKSRARGAEGDPASAASGSLPLDAVSEVVGEALDAADAVAKVWKRGSDFWKLLKAANQPPTK